MVKKNAADALDQFVHLGVKTNAIPSIKMITYKLTPNRQRGAFTLIELLVVIAIIGVLAALIFPTIGAIRERSHAATSVSNLRQMGHGINLFVAESTPQSTIVGKGRYPTGWGTHGSDGQWAGHVWQDLIAHQLEIAVLTGGKYQWTVAPDKSIFQDPGYETPYDRNNFQATSSYSYNYTLFNPTNPPHPFIDVEDARYPLKPLMVAEPSRFVLVAESDHSESWDGFILPSGWTAVGVPSHYKGGGHYLFADGHVEWIEKSEMEANGPDYFQYNGNY